MAGSKEIAGAAMMAAKSALRAGAGMVKTVTAAEKQSGKLTRMRCKDHCPAPDALISQDLLQFLILGEKSEGICIKHQWQPALCQSKPEQCLRLQSHPHARMPVPLWSGRGRQAVI